MKKKSDNIGKKDIYCTNPTSDDIQLKIKRYKPTRGDIAKFPVILCHGVLANKHSLDFGDNKKAGLRNLWKNYSLAAYLYQGGDNNDIKFDVWVPELRGRRSFRDFNCNYPDTPEKYDWCIDDYIEKDIKAIISCVQREYGFPVPVFWVGMSMGGMLGYAYGETEWGFKNLKGVVTIGSPVAFEHSHGFLFEIIIRILPPRGISFMFNLKEILEKFPALRKYIIEKGTNPDNVDEKIIDKYIELGLDNYLSSKILSQFAMFFRHNNFCRYPRCPWVYDVLDKIPLLRRCIGPHSYKDNLHKFKSPLLAIAGGADKEAPPDEVKYAVGHVGSKDVTYCEFSEGSPFTNINYGHLDFHLGHRVRKEVYPVIYGWLKERV